MPSKRNTLGLLLPFALLFTIFWLIPLFAGIVWSFTETDASGNRSWVGLDHYRFVLDDRRFWKALRNTLVYSIAVISLTLPLAVALALLLRNSKRQLQPLFVFLLLLPALTAPFVLGLVFFLFFHGRQGVLNQVLVIPFGFRAINWLKDPDWILPAIVFQSVWRWVGFIAFFLLCSLDSLPRQRNEAAKIDGAGAWSRFRFILLPHMTPVLAFCTIYLLVDSMVQYSGAVGLLGGSGGTADAGLLLVTYEHQMAFRGQGFEAATAVSMLILPLLLFGFFTFLGMAFSLRNRSGIRHGISRSLSLPIIGAGTLICLAAIILLFLIVAGIAMRMENKLFWLLLPSPVLLTLILWLLKKRSGRWITTLLLGGGSILLVYPYIWMMLAAFKSDRELYKPLVLLPESFSLQYVKRLFVGEEFGFTPAGSPPSVWLVLGLASLWLGTSLFNRWRIGILGSSITLGIALTVAGLRTLHMPFTQIFANTIFVAGLQAVGATLVAALAGYVLAQHQGRLRWLVLVATLLLITIPPEALAFPLFDWERQLGLLDTFVGLILPGLITGIGVLFFWQLSRQLPKSLLDAVRVNGGGEWHVAGLALSLMLPGLLTYGVIHFILAWHDHLLPLLIIDEEENRTLATALSSVWSSSRDYPRAMIMAAGVFIILPVGLLFGFVYKYFRSSLAEITSVDI